VDPALLFIVILLAAIFAVDAANRWWRENKWRWRRRSDDDE
jgi:hypothetical protein